MHSIAKRIVHTSINKMQVALDFMGRNSAYSVTLVTISIFIIHIKSNHFRSVVTPLNFS